jgi:hypothetical protein
MMTKEQEQAVDLAAMREAHAERWPIATQVQHDTNVAAQDIEAAKSRLERLILRHEREDGTNRDRIDALKALSAQADELIAALYRAK